MPEITLSNVSYKYSPGTPFEKNALVNINLTFRNGVITGLMGHTGCGKSTLVQLLNGLLKPTEGQILLDGKDIWEDPKKITDVRFKVGLVLQYPEYQLFEETVEKDIAYGPANMKLSPDEIKKRVGEAAFFCGIDEKLFDKSPFELSGGQKRRVAIAGVIAMRPDVLILDEPAAGLDPVGREEILGRLWSYQRNTNTTVIIVSHSMEDMAVYCDDIVVMSEARVILSGAKKDIFSQADKLLEVGLDIPQVTHLLKAIKSKGVDIRDDIFTIDEAKKEIMRLLSEKGGKK